MIRLLALLLAGFLYAPAAHAEPSLLRLGGVDYLGDLPTLIADQHDLFEQQNLSLQIDYYSSGKASLDRLRAGEIDFALMALTPLVIDALADDTPGQPDDPVILASLVHSTRLNHVVAFTDTISEPTELQGRRIGLMKGTNSELIWWLFADYHGFDPRSATIVHRPMEKLPELLANGDIDAMVTWQPWVARLKARHGKRLARLPGSNMYTAKWLLVSSRDTVDNRPDVVRALLRGYEQAIDYIDAHPDKALALYAEHIGIEADHLVESWQTLAYELSLDWSLIATFQQQLDWARRAGYSQKGDPVNILDMLAPQPLESLLPTAVGIPGTTGPPE